MAQALNYTDRQLQETVLKGDTPTFLGFVQQNEDIINQTIPVGSSNTVLHLVARAGHVELAKEVTKLCPEMVSAVNEKLETPFHEACREGKMDVVRALVETDPWVVYKVNRENQSGLFVASQRGRFDIVEYLLAYPLLLALEVDAPTTSLHVAASGGHTEIVKHILTARPDFAWKKDENGCTPLHLSCGKGHFDTTRELLRFDADLSFLPDMCGRTPLHCAAIRGKVKVIDEMLSVSLDSAEVLTNRGETVLHLGVKNNQYEAIKYLTEKLNITNFINKQDDDGNTVLHLATARKLSTMVTYLLKLGVNVNAINRKGQTALDVVMSDVSNSGSFSILPALQNAGAKRCEQLLPSYYSWEIQPVEQEKILNQRAMQSSSPNKMGEYPANHRHRRSRRGRREKQIEHQEEGIRNARKSITIVAVLIATVTFEAGINPPGGFNQLTGTSTTGRDTSFKVFVVCNIMALFLSLGIVVFLVSIIPFRRKSMMRILVVMYKVTWLSMSFMATAYMAAMWTIMPHGRGTNWALVAIVGIGGGCTLAAFVGLAVMLAKHWVRKWEGKRIKSHKRSISRVEEMQAMGRGRGETSSNSDVDNSDLESYHLY